MAIGIGKIQPLLPLVVMSTTWTEEHFDRQIDNKGSIELLCHTEVFEPDLKSAITIKLSFWSSKLRDHDFGSIFMSK